MDERQSLKVLPYLAALGTVLFWASAFAAVKFALDYFSAGSLMLLRFLVASVVLLIVCIIKRAGLPKLRDLPLFSICGVVGVFMYMWFFNMGTNMVAAGISGFIIASVPLFTLVFSIIFLKEKAKATMWIGVIISFLGIVIIAFTQITDLQLNAGVWLLLFAASLAGVFIITQRLLLRKYSVLQATAYPIAIATLFMMIFLPDLLKELPQASLTSIGIVAYLGVFPAALAYLLWGYALAKAKKTVHITSFLYLSPFLASLIAFIWLGEQMPVLAFVGGIVVVAGMVITNLFKNKKRP
ncbi:MAG: DMT family transporter [Defluviitaleaceae bacterium]|nr:DMT family transporter [Defluviitaleaceae bacterium]